MRKEKNRSRKRMVWLIGLLVLCICGCSKTAEQSEEQKEAPVIKVGVVGIAASDSALLRVNEKLGDLSQEKYGFRMELLRDDTSAGKDFAFYTDAKEGMDIRGFYYADFKKYAEKGMLLDMAPYLDKYGSELKRVLEDKAEIEKSLSGHIYGIPKTYSDTNYVGVLFNNEYVRKYQMDLSKIKKIEDMEPLLETIRKNESDIIPWAKVKTGPIAIARNPIGDLLDDMLCMVDYEDDTLQVKNMYETEEYEKRVRMIQKWYQKGYIQKDIMTSGEYGQALLEGGMTFSTEAVVRPDEREYLESKNGDKVAYAVFDQKPLIDTECDWVYVWCIARNCAYPKEAVQALNAIYGDRDILTVILYGLEGMDYVQREDGHLENPSRTEENDDSYHLYYKWMFNRLNAKLWAGVDENVKEEMEEMKQDAIVSPAYGFWFDASKVSVDLVKIQNVINKYKDKLNCGVCDVDQVLPQFRKELRQAGADQLVKEVQQQVDEWKAAQEEIVP